MSGVSDIANTVVAFTPLGLLIISAVLGWLLKMFYNKLTSFEQDFIQLIGPNGVIVQIMKTQSEMTAHVSHMAQDIREIKKQTNGD